jgi:hypothetical protein
VTTVTLSPRPLSQGPAADASVRSPEPPAPTGTADGPRPALAPAWSYGAGAVQRAVAQLWRPHLDATPLDPLTLRLLTVDRDEGLDDVY